MKKINFALFIVLISLVLFLLGNDSGFVYAKIEGYQVLKTFVQVKDIELSDGFIQSETEHFILKYKDEDAESIEVVAQEFERSYELIGRTFDYYPEEKVVVFIYNTQQEMWAYQKSVNGQAVLGLYNMGTIHILSPDAYKEQSDRPTEYFIKYGPVLHEYTHKVVDDLSGGNLELWLTEGLALYEEYEKNGVEWEPGFNYERFFTAEELRNNFMNIEELQAYRQSFDTIRLLTEKYGKNKTALLLEKLKNGNTIDKAFKSTYGIAADEFINSVPKQLY